LDEKILKIYFAKPADSEASLAAKETEMMSKKKKDKADEPKKTKARSSKRASQDVTLLTDNQAPVAAMESPAAPKLRRAAGGKKKATALELSTHDIALRAYYIAEHRRSLNLAGDEVGDWVEAERQLRKEASKKPA
jgi:hypothetical protein